MIAVAVQDACRAYGLFMTAAGYWVEVRRVVRRSFVQECRAQVLRVSRSAIRRRCAAIFRPGFSAAESGGDCWRAGLWPRHLVSLFLTRIPLAGAGACGVVLSGPRADPWDHAAGVLAVHAAGAWRGFSTARRYNLERRAGGVAGDQSEATWSRVAQDYARWRIDPLRR